MQRPQGKEPEHRVGEYQLQQVNTDVDEDQGPRSGRCRGEHAPILPVAEPALQENQIEPAVELVADFAQMADLCKPQALVAADGGSVSGVHACDHDVFFAGRRARQRGLHSAAGHFATIATAVAASASAMQVLKILRLRGLASSAFRELPNNAQITSDGMPTASLIPTM